MYKYNIQNMCDGHEYLQIILLNKSNNNNTINNIKLRHVFLSQHVMKNL